MLFVRGRKNGDNAPVASFEEGDISISNIFEDEQPHEDENGKRAGLVNYINEEQKENLSRKKEPKIEDRSEDEANDNEPDDSSPKGETKQKS